MAADPGPSAVQCASACVCFCDARLCIVTLCKLLVKYVHTHTLAHTAQLADVLSVLMHRVNLHTTWPLQY